MKRHLVIALAVLALAWPGLTLFTSCSATGYDSVAKAAIIDQLAILQPNQDFIDEITAELEAYGFEVDVYHGEEVSVKLYQKLPQHGYKLILFRAHSGLMKREEDSQIVRKQETYLFTAEKYTHTRYVYEQLNDQMLVAEMVQDSPPVFAVNYKFVIKSMEGRFQDTAIIMMGCSGTHLEDMAAAFILKGASTYMGWDGSVGMSYVEQATTVLASNLCNKRMTIEQAVAETMTQVGSDPYWATVLKYYPKESGTQTIDKVIRGTDGD